LATAFFSLGVVWRTLSLFALAARIDRFVCKLEGTQPGAIVRLVGSEHGEEGVQKLPHDSDNRLETGFAML
jgi:hypothetical protein